MNCLPCRKLALCSLTLLLCVISSLHALEPALVAPEEVLFLAHFNKSLTPEIGNVDGMVAKASITSGGKGYAFLESEPYPEAFDAVGRECYAVYPAAGNFNQDQGTLQLFVKGQWKQQAHAYCVFFKLLFTDSYDGNWGGVNSFVLRKVPDIQRLQIFQNGNLRQPGVTTADLAYAPDIWRHLTVTWCSQAKEYALYLNGESIGTARFHKMTQAPRKFLLGHPKGHGAQSLIDEVRILNRALTPEEVKQDYLYLKSGREFPSPGNKVADVSFQPIPLQPEQDNSEQVLTGDEFTIPGIKAAPLLNGELTDPIWQQARKLPALRTRQGVVDDPTTEAWIFYGPDALYIAAKMHEPDMDNLVARFDQHDQPVFNDDCLELLFDITGRPDEQFHIVVNSLGTVYDSLGGRVTWDAQGLITKTFRGKDFWTVELKLPFAAFRAPMPEPDEYYAVRVARERHHQDGKISSFPVCPKGRLADRRFLGKMIFAPFTGATERLASKMATFGMGMNMVELEVAGAQREQITIRGRLYNEKNHLQKEYLRAFPMSEKVIFALPVVDDRTARVTLSLLTDDGEVASSVVLQRNFPFVKPGLTAITQELELFANGCSDLMAIRHPIYRGVANSVNQVLAAIAQYRARTTAMIEANRAVPDAETNEIMALLNGFKKFREDYRYLVWQTSPWEYGSPTVLPPEDYSLTPTIKFQQAANERERVALNFSGLLCNRRLDIRIVPYAVTNSEQSYVPQDCFEIYAEPFTNHNGEIITAPLIRSDGNIITLTPGETVRVHVVFNSRNVNAGEYETQLVIKPLHDYQVPNRKIPVEAKVWNFTLPETREWPMNCFLWGPNRLNNDEAALLRLTHSRHINWGWTESVRYTRGFTTMRKVGKLDEGELFKPELVKQANPEFFRVARELGMKFVFGWGTCNSIEWHHLMDKRLLDLGFSREDFIFKSMISDEFAKKNIPTNAKLREEVTAINPGWTFQAVYLSTPPPTGATLEDIKEAKLTDFFKNWAVISHLITADRERGQKILNFFHQDGCAVWIYRCGIQMQKQPLLEYYRFFPWLGFLNNADGIAMWNILEARGEDGFDHRDGYDDGAAWLGNDRKPVPTKRLEALSEGLEDIAYVYELKKQIQRLGERLDKDEVEKLQQQFFSQMEELTKIASQEEVDSWRLRLGETIDRLSKLQ